MSNVSKFIDSGLLEVYVLGQATPEEAAEVERMATFHNEVREEIEAISIALEHYAEAHAVQPDPTIRPMLMATIDYMERMKSGEAPAFPPRLHARSTALDYAQWLDRKDLQLDQPIDEVLIHIIGYTPELQTAIVWMKDGAPAETHTNELESFLVIEGTCNIIIGDEVTGYGPGDIVRIPLHKSHIIEVTSSIPCKVVLERAAA